jgi:ABC-type antimicrobial peptide transport system permease subunit
LFGFGQILTRPNLAIHGFLIIPFIAIFVSCIGLLGPATYMTENRTREIGIRKVLGSSITAIVGLLVKDLVQLVIVSILIATPIAWLFMNYYLQHCFTHCNALWPNVNNSAHLTVSKKNKDIFSANVAVVRGHCSNNRYWKNNWLEGRRRT